MCRYYLFIYSFTFDITCSKNLLKVEKFGKLGMTVKKNNYFHEEYECRYIYCGHLVLNFYPSVLSLKKSLKIKMYRTINLPIILY
jgi:hypothetical protein